MGGFFGGKSEQVDVLALQCRADVQPACKQDFVEQGVEFCDVAFEALLLLRVAIFLEKLDAKPDTRQRRAQFMRGVGEQHAMRIDQLLDTSSGRVEARRKARDLVAALDL